MTPLRIAVIGAGPIGLEAALYAHSLGHDVRLFERGRVGANMRRWGHLTLFSPTSMNVSRLAERALTRAGVERSEPAGCLRGEAHVERLLEPLARHVLPSGCVVEHTRVVAVGRDGLSKRAPLGADRGAASFRLLLDGPRGEEVAGADVVLDCSGTYGNHGWLGAGGIAAPGERGLGELVRYELEPDVEARARYAGRSVLLVGAGYSAACALEMLAAMPGTRVVWLARDAASPPYRPVVDDPLAGRAGLCALGNRLAAGAEPSISFVPGAAIERFDVTLGGKIRVAIRVGERRTTETVDRVLGLVGYRPDRSLTRELQLHECYAGEGPMALSAARLGAAPGGDCLAQQSGGPETLRTPEPNFFVLGAKSFGRDGEFLIRLGIEQVRDVFRMIEGRDDLDLYVDTASTARSDR